MRIRLAEIPYLNCAPFFWNRAPVTGQQIEWITFPPKELGELARQGKIDAGPVSLLDSFTLEDRFEPVGNLGISVHSSARSVLLFTKKKLAALDGEPLGLTDESVTSVELLKVILRGKYGVEPRYRVGFEDSDSARLYIGNPALARVADEPFRSEFHSMIDLGDEWRAWQNLPFVFARWMVRKNLAPSAKKALSAFLQRNIAGARENLELAVKSSRAAHGEDVLPGDFDYLNAFCFELGNDELKAIGVFRSLLWELAEAAAAR